MISCYDLDGLTIAEAIELLSSYPLDAKIDVQTECTPSFGGGWKESDPFFVVKEK